MIFLVSFLGALFAIFVALLIVYTYVKHRLIPRIKDGFREFVAEVGPSAVFENAKLDPIEAMRQFGVSSAEAAVAIAKQSAASSATRMIYMCEDHGRCAGCPKVLAQFEAIIRHQGEESFDELEKRCHAQLRDQLASDALIDGEGEIARQRRIAAHVVEVLVREGISLRVARSAVWSCGKSKQSTFDGWLSAARTGCAESREETVS